MWCGRLCARVAGMAGWEVEACGVRRAPQTCVLHRRRHLGQSLGPKSARSSCLGARDTVADAHSTTRYLGSKFPGSLFCFRRRGGQATIGRQLCVGPSATTVVAAEPSRAMSEAEEVERLKKDLDKCNSIIKVSVRERASERERERERERNRFLGSPVERTQRQVLRRGSMRRRSPSCVSASLSLYRSAWRRKTSSTSPRRDRIRSTRSAHQRRTHGSAGAKAATASVEQVATAEPHRGHGSFPEWHGPFQGEDCLEGAAGCCGVH